MYVIGEDNLIKMKLSYQELANQYITIIMDCFDCSVDDAVDKVIKRWPLLGIGLIILEGEKIKTKLNSL